MKCLISSAICEGQVNKPPAFTFDGDMDRFSIREDTPIGMNKRKWRFKIILISCIIKYYLSFKAP